MSALEGTEGVLEHEVILEDDTAKVLFDSSVVSIEEIEARLDEVGYHPESSQLLSED